MIAHRGTFQQRVELTRSEDREREVVAEFDRLRQTEVCGRRLLVVVATKVQVPGRAEPRAYTEVQRHRALEDPPIWRHDHEACHQAVEDHQLA